MVFWGWATPTLQRNWFEKLQTGVGFAHMKRDCMIEIVVCFL
jgi:hypothetical protein